MRPLAALLVLLPTAVFAADPAPHMEDGMITASGPTITANRVPVTTGKGVVYRDVTITFQADADGNLKLANSPAVVPSSGAVANGFQPGVYEAIVPNRKLHVRVDGPSIGPGGEQEWALTTVPGSDNCTYPVSGSWQTGPAEANPMHDRLEKAQVADRTLSYGLIGAPPAPGCGTDAWAANAILGARQVGPMLVLEVFGNGPTPTGSITYRLVNTGTP